MQVESTGALLWAQSRDPWWSRDVWGKNWQSPENWDHRRRFLRLKFKRQPRVLGFIFNAFIYEQTIMKLSINVGKMGFYDDSGGHWLGRDRPLTRVTRQYEPSQPELKYIFSLKHLVQDWKAVWAISAWAAEIYLLWEQLATVDSTINHRPWIRSRTPRQHAISALIEMYFLGNISS